MSLRSVCTAGVRVSGHEFHGRLLEFARAHVPLEGSCGGDGKSLSHIPIGLFDHVVSNAAVYHLTPTDQVCLLKGVSVFRVLTCPHSHACCPGRGLCLTMAVFGVITVQSHARTLPPYNSARRYHMGRLEWQRK